MTNETTRIVTDWFLGQGELNAQVARERARFIYKDEQEMGGDEEWCLSCVGEDCREIIEQPEIADFLSLPLDAVEWDDVARALVEG